MNHRHRQSYGRHAQKERLRTVEIKSVRNPDDKIQQGSGPNDNKQDDEKSKPTASAKPHEKCKNVTSNSRRGQRTHVHTHAHARAHAHAHAHKIIEAHLNAKPTLSAMGIQRAMNELSR